MSVTFRKSLGELLVDKSVIDQKALMEAIALQKKSGKKLGKILHEKGYLDENTLYGFLEEQLGVKFITHIDHEINPEIFASIPFDYCKSKIIAPVKIDAGKILVYVSEPTNTALVNEIAFMSGKLVEVDFATESAILEFLSLYFPSAAQSKKAAQVEKEEKEEESKEESGEDFSPVVKYVTEVILNAVEKKVSDIHLEAYEKEARMRYRIDGVLHRMDDPDIKQYPAIISRIKIMAELDISEKRLPQDGRIMFNYYNRQIDIRVSIIPTVYGENVVMRILDKGKSLLSINDIGFPPEMVEIVKKEAKKPYGMILVTGPTGSGKTTTLYAILEHIRSSFENKILTIEDPVEYQIAGISQVQVHAEIGLTFAAGLRSFLRHDPDVIMVGEIRDKETSDIAVRSSLTGHLVLSTVHTNDAASTITRFLDMGIPPYLLTSTINLIIAQRLVRRICPNCKHSKTLHKNDIELLEVGDVFQAGDLVYSGKGCKVCDNTGYLGRIPIFEWIRITEPIKKAVIQGDSSMEIKELAKKEGMPTLRDSGLQLVKQGLSTVDEIEKIVSLGD